MDKDVRVVIAWLKSQDFEITRATRHVVVRHPQLPGVTYPLPQTPSDHRWEQNARSDMRKLFGGVRGVDWQSWPGITTGRNRTLRDRYTGSEVVHLLRGLRGPKGEEIFAGRLRIVEQDGARMLEIENPWFTPGSTDPIRSQRMLAMRLAPGQQKLGLPAVELLADLGVDLRARHEIECQLDFHDYARAQRSARIAEHQSTKTAQRSAARESKGL